MDWAAIIFILAIVGLFVLAIVWAGSKGKRGEKHVAVRLSHLPKEEYKVINDLLLQSNGYSSQIDHVVISVYGIFVIETKYYNGWIYGGRDSEFWTQNIYGHKNKMRNPLLQNQGHIKAISKTLNGLGNIPIYNIVAFSRKATLKTDRSLPVMYWRQVLPYIKNHKEPQISEDHAEEIYKKLLESNVTDRDARKQHIKSVKQNQRRRDVSVANGKCPRCGGNLVLREGRYGRFYGCSNYPSCKYILR